MTDTAPAPEAAPTPPTSPVGIPRIGVTPTTTPEPRQPAPRSSTLLVDAAPRRTHRAEDLLDLGLAVLDEEAFERLLAEGPDAVSP